MDKEEKNKNFFYHLAIDNLFSFLLNIGFRSGEIVRALLQKHMDLSWKPQHPLKMASGVAAHACNHKMGRGGEIHGT